MDATNCNHLSTAIDQDGAVILDTERGLISTLNSTGGYIWQRLKQGKTIEHIVAALASETGEDLSVVDRDVHDFIETLRDRRLLLR